MAFVEQGTKQPVLSCFLAELDLSNKSFIASSSTLEKHNDTSMQGLLATRALDHLSKTSIANDPTLQLASSSAIPHWMNSKQVQNDFNDASLKNGSTGNVVASTSTPRFSGAHETLGAFRALPSPKLGFGSEGQTNSGIPIESTDGLANSTVPAGPSLPLCLKSLLIPKRDGQKEEPKILKEDALSFLLHKQEKQPAKEHLMDLPFLSLGHSSRQVSHERAEEGSWVSKFPFQIASTLEQAEHGQLVQHRENLGRNLLTKSKSEWLIQSACKEVANVPSQCMGSKGQSGHCKFWVQDSLSSTLAAHDVLPQKTSLANSPLTSLWPSPATISGSNLPPLKRDWNATLMQGVKHTQLLPDFFAQQKVTVAVKANQFHVVNSDAGFNVPSLHTAICSDKTRNALIDHKSIKQQEMNNGGEALKTRTEQSLHDSPRQVDLLKVKFETLTEDAKTFKCTKFASRKSTEEHDKIVGSEAIPLTEAIALSSGSAADQAAKQSLSSSSGIDRMVGISRSGELMLFRDVATTEASTIISAGVPSFPLLEHSSNLEGLEGGKFSANKCPQLDGDWGGFLAAPIFGQTVEIDGKLMLPFQQRFEQLQKFLKKCDGSDDEYCLRALRSLSGTARSDQSAELESRAVRLSLEEGKELKRAKLLNVLEEIP